MKIPIRESVVQLRLLSPFNMDRVAAVANVVAILSITLRRPTLYMKTTTILIASLYASVSLLAGGTQVDFNSIPKTGTLLIYAHLDDDLIWMLPWWNKTEKFIGGITPATPGYKSLIHEQQLLLNSRETGINYESNWITPFQDITDNEYTEYYGKNNPAYKYLETNHVISLWNDADLVTTRKEIDKVKIKLESYIADPNTQRIITHNNWGEYGHQHHRALNAAIRELAVKHKKDVWMLGCDNGYFVDVTVPDGINYTTTDFNDELLYTGIRDIYKAFNAWTWLELVPSGRHDFIQIVDAGIDKTELLEIKPSIDIINNALKVKLNPGINTGVLADWWVLCNTNGNWYCLTPTGWSDSVFTPVYQGALNYLPETEIFSISNMLVGDYTFYFAVDFIADGIVTEDNMVVTSVNVVVR